MCLNYDPKFMKRALELAKIASDFKEVPVGAVLVSSGEIIAEAHNERESLQKPTAHAEILALERGSKALKSWRLGDCELYVTLEPCVMCAGALLQSRVKALYFGAYDPKGGACGSVVNVMKQEKLNHSIPFKGDCCSKESEELLQNFFKNLRSEKK